MRSSGAEKRRAQQLLVLLALAECVLEPANHPVVVDGCFAVLACTQCKPFSGGASLDTTQAWLTEASQHTRNSVAAEEK